MLFAAVARAQADGEGVAPRSAGVADGARLHLERHFWLLERTDGATTDPSLVEWSSDLLPRFQEEREPSWFTIEHVYRSAAAPILSSEQRGSSLVDLRVKATTRLETGDVQASGRLLAYTPEELVVGEPESATDTPRLARLRLTGAWDRLGAGLEIQSATRGIERVTTPKVQPDQEGARAWLERKAGPARFTLAVSETEDNLADDPRRPRTAKRQLSARADLTLPFGPVLGLEYDQGSADRRPPTHTLTPAHSREVSFNSLLLSLYYWQPTWEFSMSASMSPSHEAHGQGRQATSYDLSPSYRPTDRLTITPALGIAEVRYDASGLRSQTASGSVSISYGPILHALDLTLWGGYTRSLTSDGLFDATTIDATASLVWHLRRSAATRTSLAFEAGYDRYLDAVDPQGGSTSLFAQVVLKIVGF